MHYNEHTAEDQAIILSFLHNIDYQEGLDLSFEPARMLQDNEVFFSDEEAMMEAISPWKGSKGGYGIMEEELSRYFEVEDRTLEELQPFQLSWGFIARAGNGRYIVWSNSWSDSGLFLGDC